MARVAGMPRPRTVLYGTLPSQFTRVWEPDSAVPAGQTR
jgi:hypothetical protein